MNFRKVLPKLSRNTQTPSFTAVAPGWESALGGFRPMKRRVGLALSLLALSGLFFLNVPDAQAGKGSLATITGSVKDDKGKPLAGALVSLLKDGANVVIKETRTGSDGRFLAKTAPGRSGSAPMAAGFHHTPSLPGRSATTAWPIPTARAPRSLPRWENNSNDLGARARIRSCASSGANARCNCAPANCATFAS